MPLHYTCHENWELLTLFPVCIKEVRLGCNTQLTQPYCDFIKLLFCQSVLFESPNRKGKTWRIIAGTSADATADIPADIPTDNSQHAIYPISRYFIHVVKLPAHPMP